MVKICSLSVYWLQETICVVLSLIFDELVNKTKSFIIQATIEAKPSLTSS